MFIKNFIFGTFFAIVLTSCQVGQNASPAGVAIPTETKVLDNASVETQLQQSEVEPEAFISSPDGGLSGIYPSELRRKLMVFAVEPWGKSFNLNQIHYSTKGSNIIKVLELVKQTESGELSLGHLPIEGGNLPNFEIKEKGIYYFVVDGADQPNFDEEFSLTMNYGQTQIDSPRLISDVVRYYTDDSETLKAPAAHQILAPIRVENMGVTDITITGYSVQTESTGIVKDYELWDAGFKISNYYTNIVEFDLHSGPVVIGPGQTKSLDLRANLSNVRAMATDGQVAVNSQLIGLVYSINGRKINTPQLRVSLGRALF